MNTYRFASIDWPFMLKADAMVEIEAMRRGVPEFLDDAFAKRVGEICGEDQNAAGIIRGKHVRQAAHERRQMR